VRGNGPQAAVPSATNESQELYPTCIQRVFQNHTQVVTARDAASFLTGSPQAGVMKSSYTTAIGRLLGRSTWQGSERLEHATFSHDRLGHLTGMTRYQNASAGSKPVTSSWHHDSLGQLLQLDEPDSVPQHYTYSRWGELLQMHRTVASTGAVKRVVNTYDALGRVIHREQRDGNDVIAETVNDYFYDQPIAGVPQVEPTHTLGRLALATSPTGSEAFSYDAFGRINARVFTDNQGELYIEKHAFHGDGAPRSLDLLLPDAAFDPERVAYHYDSAGRGTRVTYTKNSNTQTLFEAQAIDPFGRVRQAAYGATSYTASYADVGRRLLNQVTLSSSAGSRSITYQDFDPIGRERSRLEGRSGFADATTTRSYDALGRLSSAVQTRGTTTTFNQQFSYDPLGNVLGLSSTGSETGTISTALSYLATDRDRICRIRYGADTGTECNVTHDEVGGIIVQPTATGSRQFSYFADGSVRSITDTLGSAAQFRYDAFGRIQELDLTSNVSADTRRDRRYGELFAWREVTTTGAPTSYLARRISGPGGLLATRRGAGGPWVFEFSEPRGGRFFTDENGAFVQDVDYQPYGKPTSTGAQPGSALYTSEQWNHGDLLAAFGISQLGARLYDPAIGRFLSRDPLLIPRTAATSNPYAFAMNDPVNRSDPSGLDPSICHGIDSGTCMVIERDAIESFGAEGFHYIVGGGIGYPDVPITRGPRYNGPGGGSAPDSDTDGTPIDKSVTPAAIRYDQQLQGHLSAFMAAADKCPPTPEERRRRWTQYMRPDDLPSFRTSVLDGTEESFEEARARAIGGLIGLGIVFVPALGSTVIRTLPGGSLLWPASAAASTDPGLDDFVQRLRDAGVVVLNVNVSVLGAGARKLAEIDVVTPNALIEYKSGSARAPKVIRQNRKAELCTLLPVIVFIDDVGSGARMTLRRAGRQILITNDFQLLVELIR
jgi:RHS repeat-associated protein